MKPVLRNILYGTSIILMAALTGLLVHETRRNRLQLACTDIAMHFRDSRSFVSEDDVKGYLDKLYGPYLGQRLADVDLTKMEKVLDAQSAVFKSEAWTDEEGVLHVSITQREPAVRFQKDGLGCYADDRGCLFPLQKGYTSHVPVVDGFLPIEISPGFKGEAPTESGRQWIKGILELISWLEKNRQWQDNIVQISVLPSGDLVLIPREGNERFIFGKTDGIADKFSRISEYYRSIKPSKEEGWYASVNVKFDGQIVCRR